MWFMTFTLGLVYYFLPLSLNKPIYSYSLGALAFWTQLLFYTLIGTHHYVFSPIAWWLQTVAIVFSAGMFIPVLAGTINFAMTFRGSSKQVGDSYSLPFLLIGVVLYFTGSVQGSLQAFRTTNLVWHFTDFNVAHSHITMYGIVAFMLWGCIYTLLPKLTGREPRTLLVGIHFWFALIGLMAYVVALMVGGTFKGLSWMAAQPFIDSVVLMAPYWLWRAIGGTLMLLAHFVFGYNLLDMLRPPRRQPAPTLQPLERHEYSA
jgi:cytochrome c oxidase cbb3-type subunit 1